MTSHEKHLRAVSDDGSEYEIAGPPQPAATDSGLPNFEGQEVDFARLKLTSASNLEAPDYPSHIDDVVRMYVEGRVTRIDHVVDDASGKLKRVQTIKVVAAMQLAWDFDTGVFDG